MLDLHNYRKRYERQKILLWKHNISQRNKEIIWKFHDHLTVLGVTIPRILKYLDKLPRIASWLKKDFDKVTKADIERIFVKINQRTDISISTKIDYSILVKRFYKWLLGKDEEYPEQVKWLKTTLKFKDKHIPSQADLITEEEVQKLIKAADHPRNKAFISLLYESGCRIGELANLKISNVLFDQYGCVLNVNGKTGPRRIRVVNSTSYLTQWLEMHPCKNDREQAVWLILNNSNKREPMSYNTIRNLLKELFSKTGINKRCNPHIFRHSRATFLANHMTEAQMKAYFGWVQQSDMASTYVHLSGRDTDNAILELNGLAKRQDKESAIKPKQCPKCSMINSNTSNYCSRCSSVLDIETAMQLQNELNRKDSQQQGVGNLMGALLEDKEFKELLLKKIVDMKLGKQLEAI